MGILYIVPTPVGNMDDMTFRAIKVLQEADLVLAEDTRTSGILLKHFDIQNRLMSHHKFNEHGTSSAVVSRLLAGENVALISDAGTPGISDPGFFLVREAVKAGIEVYTLPGATAFVPALVSSGLPCDRFVFEGFLPPKKGRQTMPLLQSGARWCSMNHPIVCSRPYSSLRRCLVLSDRLRCAARSPRYTRRVCEAVFMSLLPISQLPSPEERLLLLWKGAT